MKKLRILLADDHQMVREGLRLLIDAHPNMRVAGQAASGKEVVAMARELEPDVVVMDLSMPELNGLRATQLLKAQNPAAKVVVLTAHEDESYLNELCKAGASGYVLKRSAGDELIQAISTVANGGLYFEQSLASRALAGRLAPKAANSSETRTDLSERERSVLTLLAWGYSNKEIAAELAISVKTVETYKVRVGEKLGLRSRTEMVQFALRKGWLSDSPPCPPVTR